MMDVCDKQNGHNQTNAIHSIHSLSLSVLIAESKATLQIESNPDPNFNCKQSTQASLSFMSCVRYINVQAYKYSTAIHINSVLLLPSTCVCSRGVRVCKQHLASIQLGIKNEGKWKGTRKTLSLLQLFAWLNALSLSLSLSYVPFSSGSYSESRKLSQAHFKHNFTSLQFFLTSRNNARYIKHYTYVLITILPQFGIV